MKKIITSTLLLSISFLSLASTLEDKATAGDISAAYQLAEFYENKNDIKKAMFWYKQAAKLSITNQETAFIIKDETVNVDTTQDDINIEKVDLLTTTKIANKDRQHIVSDRLMIYQRHETDNEILQFMDTAFGLRPYHSNYILPVTYDSKSHSDGRKHVETTFQISFRKDILTNSFGFDETIGFAYTQRNWWQITESSSPFRETNYLPEVYVRIPNKDENSMLKGLQFAFIHESNGQGNEAGKSRSWNRLYLEGYLRYQDIFIVPRVWYKIYENKKHDDNHDIEDYLGYGDLNVFIPYEKHLVKVMLRNNLKLNDNHGAIQADWTYPLGDTGLFAYLQYFYGYGESLIDYNKKTNRFGVGIALSR